MFWTKQFLVFVALAGLFSLLAPKPFSQFPATEQIGIMLCLFAVATGAAAFLNRR